MERPLRPRQLASLHAWGPEWKGRNAGWRGKGHRGDRLNRHLG
jgi:hypothetical protein